MTPDKSSDERRRKYSAARRGLPSAMRALGSRGKTPEVSRGVTLTKPQRTILIISANAKERAAWRNALKREREYAYTFAEEESGQKGLETYLKLKPDCVLLADKLPDADGLTVLTQMKAESGEEPLPVLMLAEEPDGTIAAQATANGAQDYRAKQDTEPEYLRRMVYGVMEKMAVSRALHQQRQFWEEKIHELETQLAASQLEIAERGQAEREGEESLARERQAREMAEAANRSKDEFLALVSHELRAPLNAMLGWARILKTRKVDETVQARAIEIIERSAQSQQQLIEDLLDTARIITGKLRLEVMPVDLMPVIEAAVDVVRPAAEAKGIVIGLALDAQPGIVTGDPGRLQQVVWNLLSNAVKFTPQGGRVTVQLARVDPHVQLAVYDTGRGITAESLPYVFDRFHQGDSSNTRRYSGLGLGLSLVRHLVELHGGTISAESAGEGQGAAFTLNLPLRAVRTERRSQISNEAPDFQAALVGLQVLVVDDETDARELVTAVLEQYGARVTAVASAAEALAVITSNLGALPDVIVSDIGMPGEDGYSLIRRVRELDVEYGRQIPAIALTAYGRATDRIRALSAGFQTHVPKPVEPVELAMVIASVTGHAGKGVNV